MGEFYENDSTNESIQLETPDETSPAGGYDAAPSSQAMQTLMEAAQQVFESQHEKDLERIRREQETERKIDILKQKVADEETEVDKLRLARLQLQEEEDRQRRQQAGKEDWNDKLDRMSKNKNEAETAPEEDAGPPMYEVLTRRERNLILLALCTGQFLAALDMTIVVIALSDIVRELGEPEYLSWVLSAYMLTSAATTALSGRFSDVYGRRKTYMFMLFMFLVGSCLCGASTNIWFLIASRAIQGVGGGGIMGLTNVIVADIVAPADRGRIVGAVSASFGIATMSGPVIGGLIVTYISWRWVFYINLPIIAITFALIFRFTRKLVSKGKKLALDYLGAILIVCCSSCFVLFVTWGGAADGYPWDSVIIILLIVATIVFGALFTFQELRHPLPILQLRLLGQRNVALCMGLMFCAYGCMMGVIAYLPIYYQEGLHDTAVIAGLKTMPRTVGFVLAAPLAGRLMDKVQLSILLTGGCLLALTATAAFTVLTVETGYWLSAILFIIQGLGMGTQIPIATVTVQNSAKPQDVGSAMAGFSFLGIIGGSLCVAIYGAGFQSMLISEAKARHTPEVGVAAAVARVCLIGCAPAALGTIFAMAIGKVELKKFPKGQEPAAEAVL